MSKTRASLRAVVAASAFAASAACAQGTPKDSPLRSAGDSHSQAPPSQDSVAVHRFVQGFYDWYTPIASKRHDSPAWWSVLDSATSLLDPELATAIRGDSAARQEMIDWREMLNFDPFLESQDPCPRYEVSEVRRDGLRYQVVVRPVCPSGEGPRFVRSRPIVEVFPAAAGWRIANIWYVRPDSTKHDLRSMLCDWARADRRPEKRPARC